MLPLAPPDGGSAAAAVGGGRFDSSSSSMVPVPTPIYPLLWLWTCRCCAVCEGYTTKRAIKSTYKGISTQIWRQISIGESVLNSPVPCFFFLVSEFNEAFPPFWN
jgi:hypothetical protein